MKKYYVSYPRNFSNEYTVYAAESKKAVEQAEAWLEEHEGRINSSFERITRKEAEELVESLNPKAYVLLDDIVGSNGSKLEYDAYYTFSGEHLIPGRDF